MKRKPETGGPPAAPDAGQVRSRALGLLARREHSARELGRKLLQRGFPRDLVGPVLEGLAGEGLLSETRYAGEFARSRVARGQGPLKIAAELRQQGLTDAQVEQALTAADTDWMELARTARRKRFGASPPGTLADRARQMRFLQSRGFTADHIRRALGGGPED